MIMMMMISTRTAAGEAKASRSSRAQLGRPTRPVCSGAFYTRGDHRAIATWQMTAERESPSGPVLASSSAGSLPPFRAVRKLHVMMRRLLPLLARLATAHSHRCVRGGWSEGMCSLGIPFQFSLSCFFLKKNLVETKKKNPTLTSLRK